jgi:hypothetical protein
MASLDRIRTDGFRHWYQRQLIESHAFLVSWFLGVIVLVSGFEVFGSDAASRMPGVLLMLGGLALSLYSWKRYRFLFDVAERLGEQAVCPGCRVYARFKVLSSAPAPLPDGGDASLENHGGGVWLHAQCRKCGEEWTLK